MSHLIFQRAFPDEEVLKLVEGQNILCKLLASLAYQLTILVYKTLTCYVQV